MTTRLISLLCALIILPLSATAEEISYTFFDVAYINNDMDASVSYTEIDTGDEYYAKVDDGDGFGLRGSWAFHPNWHVFGGYADTDTGLDLSVTSMDGVGTPIEESFSLDGDMVDWTIGVGYNYSFTEKVSGFAQVSYDNRDVDFDSVEILGETENLDIDDDGVGAKLGLRGRVTDWLELGGHVRYSDVAAIDLMADAEDDILDSDTLYGFGAEVKVNEQFRICGEVEIGEDVTMAGLFGRYAFGDGS